MRFLKSALVALTLGVLAQPAAASPISYTPLSYTSYGLTVTLTGMPNANAFTRIDLAPGVSNYLNKGVLLTTQPNQALVIHFSQPVLAWGFNVMLFSTTPDDIKFDEYVGGLGGTLVDGRTETISNPGPGGYVEYGYGFGGVDFDTVVLWTPSGVPFAIDDLGVALPVGNGYVFPDYDFEAPEPMTLALFGAGLAGLGAMRRKKKAA